MSNEVIVIGAIVVFLILLFAEMPVAFALGFTGALGIVALNSFGVASNVLASLPFATASQYTLIVLPMYMLLGAFVMHAGLAERLYAFAHILTRRFPGGLGVATVAACAGFAAVSGSSVATAATIGKVAVTEMTRHGYKERFAAGIVAIAATLGILIPPSIILVIYAVLTGESVGRLYAAGIIPGILSAAVYAITIVILARSAKFVTKERVKVMAGAATSGDGTTVIDGGRAEPDAGSSTAPVRLSAAMIRSALWVALIFLVVVVGLFAGIMTATESAAVAALVAVAILVIERGREGLRSVMGSIRAALSESAAVTSMSFAIMIGAAIFTYFLVAARIPSQISVALTSLDVAPIIIVLLILVALVPLGMFLDSLAILVVVVPLVYPTIIDLGFDGVWFAILMVKMIELSLITPPVGVNCFVISAVAKVKLEAVFRGVLPFYVSELIIIGLLVAFPEIVLFLPNLIP
ncbi:TRAP transporter large permease [Microbacterium sp. A84]|uniref:TRAP transporter large permease n=1 Tax=Microbacterium sp. A84 TaxID=3450715 RepID=UPI003F42531F